MWGGVSSCFGQIQGPILVNGKLTFAQITESFKDWCRLMRRWYEEGFFTEEDLERNIELSFDKIAQGKIAATPISLLHINRETDITVPPVSMAQDSEVVVIPPLVGPEGHRGWFAMQEVWQKGFYVMKNVDDKALARILRIVDFLYFSNEENYIQARYSRDRIHFTWEGRQWDSLPIRKDPSQIPKGYAKVGGFGEAGVPVFSMDHLRYEVPSMVYEIYNLIDEEKLIMPYTHITFEDPTLMVELREAIREIWRLPDDFARNAILHGVDVDAVWDDYVESWKKRGGERLIELYKELPITKELLKGSIVYHPH
jgi:hypothetical protein